MKSLIFDAGPIISLATNNLLWLLEPLKKDFKGNFYLTDAVKRELVDKPLETKKFKFEAIQIERLIENGILDIVHDNFVAQETPKLLSTANNIFKTDNDYYIKIVHFAEMSVIAAALSLNANVIVIDEKITRLLIENPRMIFIILRKTLHTPISINENNLKEFNAAVSKIKTIRSVELVTMGYERGLLDSFITNLSNARKDLLESVLWGLKLNGCAVSKDEIEQIMKIETK